MRYPINYKTLIILIIIFFDFKVLGKVCETKIIKNIKETIEKIEKKCEKGDKMLLKFDIKIRSEELIVKFCNLKHTIVVNDQIKTIHQRGSTNYIICIYQKSE